MAGSARQGSAPAGGDRVTEPNEADDLLDARQFVSLVGSAVRNPALQGTFDTLQLPPGRKPAADLLQLAQWFRGLPEADRQMTARLLAHAVDSALFGVMCLLDGVRSVNPRPGVSQRLWLHAELEHGRRRLLNNPTGANPELHDRYKDAAAHAALPE
jgi:hypothetical protein